MLIPNKLKLTKKVLYKVAKPISFHDSAQVLRLSRIMHEFMTANNGIGLAATQVGISKQIFVMNCNSIAKTCCNPKIINASDETCSNFEGCLSFPQQTVNVKRACLIQVKYQNEQGQWCEETLNNIESVCFQHELDHLNGITMHERKVDEISNSFGLTFRI